MKTAAKIILVLAIILCSCQRHNNTDIGREYAWDHLFTIEGYAFYFMDVYNDGLDLTEYYSQIDDTTWRKNIEPTDNIDKTTGFIIFKRCPYNNTLVVTADIQEPDDEFMTYIRLRNLWFVILLQTRTNAHITSSSMPVYCLSVLRPMAFRTERLI